MQGMRRSGTTILYDALLEDPELHCFYEPLREDTETPGGGSGARESDPFAETRALRLAFRDQHYPDLDIDEFNLGGPGNPEAELGPDLPEHCAGFLRTLLQRDEPVLIKETRFYDKLEAVRGIAPENAALVHVVRDPRAVAASMMMGRGRKRADAYRSPEVFFSEREQRKLWSSRQLSKLLLQRPEYSHIRKPANFERILLVWKHTFESTWREGRLLFGDRYVLLRNEELRADPVAGDRPRLRGDRPEDPSRGGRVGAAGRSRSPRFRTPPTTRAGARPSRGSRCRRCSRTPDTEDWPTRSSRSPPPRRGIFGRARGRVRSGR